MEMLRWQGGAEDNGVLSVSPPESEVRFGGLNLILIALNKAGPALCLPGEDLSLTESVIVAPLKPADWATTGPGAAEQREWP